MRRCPSIGTAIHARSAHAGTSASTTAPGVGANGSEARTVDIGSASRCWDAREGRESWAIPTTAPSTSTTRAESGLAHEICRRRVDRPTDPFIFVQPIRVIIRTTMNLQRRTFLLVTGTVIGSLRLHAQSTPQSMTVYKDPTCGCCSQWVEQLKKSGFAATINQTPDIDAVKTKYGVPVRARSCHTALVDRYVLEG